MSVDENLVYLPKTVEDAEPLAKQALEEAKRRIGSVPNIYGLMANSPGLLASYTASDRIFRESAALSAKEKEIVYLTISREHGCRYCVAVHSTLADGMSRVPPAVTLNSP